MKKLAIAAMATTALTAFGFVPAARADVENPAWTIIDSTAVTQAGTTSATGYDIGEAFSTNGAVDVSALGYFYDGSQWGGPVTVNLYDSQGNNVATAIVDTSLIGTSDYVIGDFIYTNISDVIINGNYEIDAVGNTDGQIYISTGANYTVDPTVNYLGEGQQIDGTAGPQLGGFGNLTGVFGGDFLGVPEPATMTLLGAGLVGLGLIRRRKRA